MDKLSEKNMEKLAKNKILRYSLWKVIYAMLIFLLSIQRWF